eukprot:353664-Hanusia_phi.AAC.1
MDTDDHSTGSFRVRAGPLIGSARIRDCCSGTVPGPGSTEQWERPAAPRRGGRAPQRSCAVRRARGSRQLTESGGLRAGMPRCHHDGTGVGSQ